MFFINTSFRKNKHKKALAKCEIISYPLYRACNFVTVLCSPYVPPVLQCKLSEIRDTIGSKCVCVKYTSFDQLRQTGYSTTPLVCINPDHPTTTQMAVKYGFHSLTGNVSHITLVRGGTKMEKILIPVVHISGGNEHKYTCVPESWYAVITYEKYRRDITFVHCETKQPWAVSVWYVDARRNSMQRAAGLDVCRIIHEFKPSKIFLSRIRPAELVEIGTILANGGITLVPESYDLRRAQVERVANIGD
jgi:hypothetical protein